MSNVVELKPRLRKRNGLSRQIGAALGPAQILLFSGVRYERWDDLTDNPDGGRQSGASRRRRSTAS